MNTLLEVKMNFPHLSKEECINIAQFILDREEKMTQELLKRFEKIIAPTF